MSKQASKSPAFSTTRKAPLRDSTRIAMMWAAFDSATGEITSKHLPVIAEQCGFNPTTVRIQFYAWRATRSQKKGQPS